MPSTVASCEAGAPPGDLLVATGGFVAERGIYGVVWLDAALNVVCRFGDIAGRLVQGEPVTASFPAFIGLEEEIRRLQSEPHRSVTVPDVSLAGAQGQDERVNLAIFWMAETGYFVLLVARAVARTDHSRALAAEQRRRLIAEEALAEKARELARANAELAIANRDLEEFAYVISHDLRAPLRGLRYAAGDAEAAIARGEQQEAQQHLRLVAERSRRMGTMLSGLLEYSRIGRKAEAVGPVDTAALVDEIAAAANAGREHRITREGEWPTLETLAEPFDIVLRNLVDNAVKHHDRTDGRIVLTCRDHRDHLAIEIADDGPGIAAEWHEAIFEPFKRVAEGEATAEGAGIGLALVKKTVERCGGSIEVHSEPAERRGTTFRLVWPKRLGS